MNGPLLRVRDLTATVTTRREVIQAVRGISFDINADEAVGFVGESGCGKSVTAKALMRIAPEGAAVGLGGSVSFWGQELLGLGEDEMRDLRGRRIAMVFQDPMTSLNPVMSIGAQMADMLHRHLGLTGRPARERSVELLDLVGIPDPARRIDDFPHQFSGGQRQRVLIAIAISCEPDLLIADEPTTALDVTVQAQILALLKRLQTDRRMGLLFITHDLGIVRKIADRVCVMYKGEIVEEGPTARIFADPQHRYTKHLLAAEPKGRPPAANLNAPMVMEAKDLKVWFPIRTGLMRRTTGHVKAVNGIDLSVRAGQTVGVVGESGSGKTTLGLALTRMIASKGEIAFEGRRIDDRSFKAMREFRSAIQIVFQDPYGSLSPRMSVADIVAEGLEVHEKRIGADERDARVVAALNEVGLDPETRFRYPHEFSGGQRQRIAIARAMILKPRFVMLDEPTSALDMSVQAQVVDLLRDLQAKHDLAYLFISHDLKVVRALANEVIVMRAGEVVERGTSDEIFERPRTDYTKALMAAAFDIEAVPTPALAS